jgi:dipeptidyl aminopeptidase/acylaminoacyl peptidase
MRYSHRRFRIMLGLLVSAVFCASASLYAQQTPLLDRGQFFEDPVVSDLQISPDGRLFAFRAPFDGQLELWISRRHLGVDSAIRVSDGPAQVFEWSRDSQYLLFLRDGDGDENFHLHAVEADTTGAGVVRDLTPDAGVQARLYALPDSEPNIVVAGLNDRDPQAHDVYRIDITTGERELVQLNEAEVAHWLTDLDGVPRVAVRYGPDGGTELLGVRGDTLIPAFGCSPDETCVPLRFHQANRRFYLVTDQGDRERTELVLFHPETFEIEEVDRDPEGRVDFGEAIFEPGSDKLVATVYHDDTTRVYSQDSVFTIDLEWLAERQAFGSLALTSASADDALWVLEVENDTNPGSFYLYNRWYDTVEPIAESMPSLSRDYLAATTWVTYRTSDGEEINALLTRPSADSVGGLPAVLLPHDGPRSRDRLTFDPMVQFLVNRGYAVLQPNFRGSSGYGKQFRAAGIRAWGTGVMQQDLTDGARFLVDRGIADPNRIGILGFGYGGYAALAGLLFTPDMFAAGAAIGAMTDLSTYVSSRDLLALPALHHSLGDPDLPEDRIRLDSLSPLREVSAITRPTLLAHGVNNPDVSVGQTERLVTALRSAGKDSEYLRASGEGRRFRRAANRIAFAAALERFFAEHLGGRVQQAMAQDLALNLADMTVDPGEPVGTAALTLTAPLPAADGSSVEPATFVYRITTSDGGETEFTRSVLSENYEGSEIWRVIDSTLVPVLSSFEFDSTQFMDDNFEYEPELSGEMMAAADTVDVDRSSLLPLRRRTGGLSSMSVDFSADRVTGEVFVSDFVDDIDVPLEAPVFSDGMGLDLVIAGLPLTDGYETGLRSFDVQLGQIVPQMLAVTGADQVDTPAGSYDVFRVTLNPVGTRYAEPRVLFVRQQAPHILIRSVIQVQSEFGNYDQTTELVSVTGGSR